MAKIPVILDCDPGADDTLALMLAYRMEELDLKAITTVAGNVEIEHTFRNGRNVMAYLGADVPVYRGAEKPLNKELHTAVHVHGENGMGGMILEESKAAVETEAAWDGMYRIAKAEQGDIVLIAIGPLTNLAIAFEKYPDLKEYIKRIIIMGGAIKGGNVTPHAEFNIFVDPEAAAKVFQCGLPVYMCGLDVTMESYMTRKEIEKLAELGSKEAQLFHDVIQKSLAFYEDMLHRPGVALHDPTAVLFATEAELFKGKWMCLYAETAKGETNGKTVVSEGKENVFVVTEVNREAFVKKLFELMAKY